MNKQEFFQFQSEFFSACQEISKAKNADYTGAVDNPFGNFESVNVLGISTEAGFLTRMMDKMKRIASFVEKGELLVKDESVTDTLRDLANYSCLLAGYIKSKRGDGTITREVVDETRKQLEEAFNGKEPNWEGDLAYNQLMTEISMRK
jgi:hypothetical protein